MVHLKLLKMRLSTAASLVCQLLALLTIAECQYQQCVESRCSRAGPAVRFPFRIVGQQPVHCGYPGFDLSCTEDGKTKLNVTFPVSFFVHKINYALKQVQIQNPKVCYAKQLLNLNLEPIASHLMRLTSYSLYNCPEKPYYGGEEYYYPQEVTCLAHRGSKVFATGPRDLVLETYTLVGCTKMYDVSYPSYIFASRIIWKWSIPEACIGCESDAKICSRTRTGNRTTIRCFDAPAKPTPKVPITIIIGAVAGASALLVSAVALIVYTNQSSKSEKDAELEKFLEDYKDRMPVRYTYTDIKRMTSHFKTKLGQGGYGTVYKGKLPGGTLVAVKLLDYTKGSGEDFVNEVATMANVHHVNVVRLVGFCADGLTQALVFEYLPNGSLDKYISSVVDDNIRYLDWKKLDEIALGTAKGIEYLHQGCDHKILHLDIKPHNILLDQHFNPKVCDFGQAKLCARDQSAVSMDTARGTMGYIAPEVYSRNFGNVSTKSDVYSFGMLLLEVVGGTPSNFSSASGDRDQVYVPERVYNLLEHGEKFGFRIKDDGDYKIVKKLAITGLWCTQWLAADRPSTKGVVQMLEGDGDSLRMPPNPLASSNQMTIRHSKQARNFHTSLEIITEME